MTIGPSSCLHAVTLPEDPNFTVCVIQPGMRPLTSKYKYKSFLLNINILRPKVSDRKFGVNIQIKYKYEHILQFRQDPG